jgi:hypothetical protein
MPDDDRPRRRRLGGDPLEPAQAADPVGRQPPDLLLDLGRHRRDRVVVVRIDAHDAGRLRCAKPDREDRPEHDRHLAEDVPGMAHADDAVDAVDGLDRLDLPLEHGEQRPLAALWRRVLARRQAHVGCRPRELLALLGVEAREQRHLADLIGSHHGTGDSTRSPNARAMEPRRSHPRRPDRQRSDGENALLRRRPTWNPITPGPKSSTAPQQ